MARYKIILAYDGTNFSGYQRQASSRTIQSVVEHALRELGWTGKSVFSAGRTDAGVHACGQVIAIDLEWSHSSGQLQSAINACLPADVAVRSVTSVPVEFHPRYSARARRYCYRLFCDRTRHPLKERYAWRVWPAVSLTSLQVSASYLIGIHDFAAFGTPPKKGGSTIREILCAAWKEDTEDLLFEIVGNAFLFRMVRRLVSLQVEIGQGRRLPEDIISLLEAGVDSPIEGLAPAQGLTLVEILYPSESGGHEDQMT